MLLTRAAPQFSELLGRAAAFHSLGPGSAPRPTNRSFRLTRFPSISDTRRAQKSAKASFPGLAGADCGGSPVMQARKTGRMAGSSTRRGLETSTMAIACCCRLCCQHPKPATLARRAARRCLALGTKLQHLLSPRKPCSSHWGAVCVCPCRFAPTAAAHARVAANRSTSMGTTPWPAPARGCWHDARKPSSEPGFA